MENSASFSSSLCQSDHCRKNSSGFLSSQRWCGFHRDWRNIFPLITNGAKKPMGSKIDEVRLITFRRVSTSSFGLILNTNVMLNIPAGDYQSSLNGQSTFISDTSHRLRSLLLGDCIKQASVI